MQTTRLNVAILVGALFGIVCSVTPARAAEPDRKAVESVKGVPVRVAFALGSYAAFRQVGSEVMGDLVLLEVTAVHNHLNEMSPHVMYMHYERRGEAVQLAKASRQALSVSATPLGGPAMPPPRTRPRWTRSRSSKNSVGDHGGLRPRRQEVNPVARTLSQHGVDVTAIHNDALLDAPRLFYMHFWAWMHRRSWLRA